MYFFFHRSGREVAKVEARRGPGFSGVEILMPALEYIFVSSDD